MASTSRANPPPNHHADYPQFSGVFGVIAALRFTVDRGADADLAVALTATGAGDDVVDIGCGPGVAARRAAAGGASVVGVDPAAVMLRVGRPLTRRGVAVGYRLGTAEALPCGERSASVVWSLSTVHHWRDLDAGLAEVRRVLRPVGRFLAVERRVEPGATGHAGHGWTDDQAGLFAEDCRAAGFVDVEVGHHPGRRRSVLWVLAHGPDESL